MFFRHLAIAILLIATFADAAKAENPPNKSAIGRSVPAKKYIPSRWDEMQNVARIVALEIAKHKQDGTDPKYFYALASTNLCYRDIAIAAYYNPQTPVEADKTAKAADADVLGKALLKRNIALGNQSGTGCFVKSCKKRTVEIMLTQEGLGIYDEPIRKEIDYSARIIHSQ